LANGEGKFLLKREKQLSEKRGHVWKNAVASSDTFSWQVKTLVRANDPRKMDATYQHVKWDRLLTANEVVAVRVFAKELQRQHANSLARGHSSFYCI
jgi:hypothetical protein